MKFVLLTAEELRGLVLDAVKEALADLRPRPEADIMDTAQTADLLGVHPKTIAALIARRRLPTLRRLGKLRRFSRRAVLKWLAKRG